MDDDIQLQAADVLAVALERLQHYPEHTLLGVEGVTIVDGKPYKAANHIRKGSVQSTDDLVCDIVKGKFMLMRTRALHRSVSLGTITDRSEDDIAVSGLMADGRRGQHRCLPVLWPKINLIDAPHALWRQAGHFERRTTACARYFAPSREP